MLLIKIGMPVHFGSEINQVSGFGHPGSILVEGVRGIWINQCTFYDGIQWTKDVVVPGMYIGESVRGTTPSRIGIIKSLEKDALVVLFDNAVETWISDVFTPNHYSSVSYKFSRNRQNWEWAW